jgi:hypothetical protein
LSNSTSGGKNFVRTTLLFSTQAVLDVPKPDFSGMRGNFVGKQARTGSSATSDYPLSVWRLAMKKKKKPFHVSSWELDVPFARIGTGTRRNTFKFHQMPRAAARAVFGTGNTLAVAGCRMLTWRGTIAPVAHGLRNSERHGGYAFCRDRVWQGTPEACPVPATRPATMGFEPWVR